MGVEDLVQRAAVRHCDRVHGNQESYRQRKTVLRLFSCPAVPLTENGTEERYTEGRPKPMRILIVEDEKRIQDFLSRGLESGGYAVDVAADGNTAIELVHSTEYDLIILDLMLPDTDGLTVLEKIRNRKVNPPVLILSAREGVDDRVRGLELGADDYLVKPFAFVELLARVRVRLKRGQPTPERLEVGDL